MSLKGSFLLPLSSVALELYARAKNCMHCLLVEVLLTYRRHLSLCLTLLSIVGCFTFLALRQYIPISYDSQECPCISRCLLEDGTTEENSSHSGITHLCIVFIMWFFVFTKLQPQEVLFLPHPWSGSKNMMGCSMRGTVLETPSVMELSLWNGVVLALEPECVGSYSVLIIY